MTATLLVGCGVLMTKERVNITDYTTLQETRINIHWSPVLFNINALGSAEM